MFGMRYRHDWNFEQFVIVLLRTILIYMIAGLVFPDFFGDASVDLKESFYSHRRWFFFLGFALIVVSVCTDLVLYRKLPSPTNFTFHGIFGVTLLVGASTKKNCITRHWSSLRSLFLFSTSSCCLPECNNSRNLSGALPFGKHSDFHFAKISSINRWRQIALSG